MTLTDAQCDEFRRHPGSFNEMVRAIYQAGLAFRQMEVEPWAYAATAADGHAGFITTHPEKYPEVEWFPIWRTPPTNSPAQSAPEQPGSQSNADTPIPPADGTTASVKEGSIPSGGADPTYDVEMEELSREMTAKHFQAQAKGETT